MKKSACLILPPLVGVLFVVGFFPIIRELFTMWAESEDYYFAFFALPVAIYMVWQKRTVLQEWQGRGVLGLILLLAVTLLHGVTLTLNVPTISFLVMLMWVVAAFVFLGGLRALPELIVPLVLALLLLPFSDSLYATVTMPLQLKVSQLSEQIAQLIHVPIYREGNILQIPTKVFQVVDACSGLRSLVALNCLSLMFGYFTLRRNRSIMLLFLTSIPVAFVVNIVRVVTMVLAFHFFQIDLTEGSGHVFTGALVFTVALALLYLFQRIIELWEIKRA
ncbi:exosortase/archaeosortase family protein [Desulfogranum mediterraneum]|uniref:exosortase/archaeosortase family protein n=1 Tax=Desulfogranum mediterraneum TaxID=160661 RepID=UPI0004153D86|nr:exosortase/archaeosortase family protein [Desulfogranum mediterraneum]